MFNLLSRKILIYFSKRWGEGSLVLVHTGTPSLNPNGYIVIYTLVKGLESNQPLPHQVCFRRHFP